MNRRTLIKAGAALIAAPAILRPKPAKAVDAFVGCILKNTVDSGSTNFNAIPVTWSAEDIDTDGFHSTSVNTQLITIPLAMNGRYGIFSTYINLANGSGSMWGRVFIQRPAIDSYGVNGWTNNVAVSDGQLFAITPPKLLTTAETYQVLLQVSDTSTILVAASSSFTLQVVG